MQGIAAKLQPYEFPRLIYLEDKPFTPENHKLTPSFKLNHHFLKQCYRETLDAMYADHFPAMSTSSAVSQRLKLLLHESGADKNMSMQELGVDSLATIRFATQIQKEFNLSSLPIDILVDKNKSIDDIADDIQNLSLAPQHFDQDFWEAECQLDPEIQCKLQEHLHNGEQEPPMIEFDGEKVVLLTGATGFLGIHLLYELIHLNNVQRVYCLVRVSEKQNQKSTDKQDSSRVYQDIARKRISDNWDVYCLSVDPLLFNSKVIPVVGDMSEYCFGIADSQYEEISGEVNVIYHCGCYVNGVFPYLALKPANVTGTVEVIRFACHDPKKLKPVVHVSTLSVMTNDIFEDSEFVINAYSLNANSGYGTSKWVAEYLLKTAQQLGLTVTIFRCGTISASTVTGCSNVKDFLSKLIMGIVQLGKYPTTDELFDMAPVDIVANAIVTLGNSEKGTGKNYHMSNSSRKMTVSIREMCEFIQSFGYKLSPLPYSSWRSLILNLLPEHNQLFPLRNYFKGSTFPSIRPFDCSNTVKYLHNVNERDESTSELTEKSGGVREWKCFKITESLIHKNLQFYINSQLIHSPKHHLPKE